MVSVFTVLGVKSFVVPTDDAAETVTASRDLPDGVAVTVGVGSSLLTVSVRLGNDLDTPLTPSAEIVNTLPSASSTPLSAAVTMIASLVVAPAAMVSMLLLGESVAPPASAPVEATGDATPG